MTLPSGTPPSSAQLDLQDAAQRSDDAIVAATRAWLERAVIGLNLCPFAKAPYVRGQIRFCVVRVDTPQALLEALGEELEVLAEAPPERIETTLLIHPQVLQDFLDYNGFIELADALLVERALDGILQVAHFHPDFQFADSPGDDITNFSNRSPFPMLHLLREDSVDRAVAAFPDAAVIYRKNITTLRALGHAGWNALWDSKEPDPNA